MSVERIIGWAIDRDYLADPGEPSRVGYGMVDDQPADTFGSRIVNAGTVYVTADLSAADVVDAVRFRLLDDDGEPYYGGAIRRDWIDGEEEQAFSPLAFGMADAGCTELQYRYASDDDWRSL